MYHADAKEYIAGANFIYQIKQPFLNIKKVLIGGHFRDPINFKTDAAIVTAGVYLKQIYAGFSYDINVSNFSSATQHRGAIEFSLVYMGLKTNNDFTTIPCERY